MSRLTSLRAVLPLAVVLFQAAPSLAAQDATALLNDVSQRYADAKSYHIEAVEERTITSDLIRHWDKTLTTAISMKDGRYRYEGHSGMGSSIVVSDGTVRWDYHPDDHLYTREAASVSDPPDHIKGPEEMATYNARFLITKMAHMADRVKSASMLHDQTISVNGKKVRCYVVHYAEILQNSDSTLEWDVWIDKSRKTVVKTFSRGKGYAPTGAGGRMPRNNETSILYPVVELDQQEPSSSFQFSAPADAKLVAEFPLAFAHVPAPVDHVDLTGHSAPELQLTSSAGQVTKLSSFHGKPVFIEFWATWCGPCVDLMPALSKLYTETAHKGLVWISIDSDKDSTAADTFLAREHATWPNYHDNDGHYGAVLHRGGIPLGVLIDGEGKITFYKSGYEIGDLRSAIAKLSPEFTSVGATSTKAEDTPAKKVE